MPTLILIRHGQSAWNLENRFTGWWDVDITEAGAQEARRAGDELKAAGHELDIAFTSLQTRAIKTLNLLLEHMGQLWVPVIKDWHLNERHYGGLTGRNKQEMIDKVGAEQVHIWRRSFDVPPPPLAAESAFNVAHDRRYAGIAVPTTESLKDTIARALPYYNEQIAPQLRLGKRVIVAAHGNSLRALVKHLDGISDADIADLEIPTGQPLIYTLDADLKPISRTYLG